MYRVVCGLQTYYCMASIHIYMVTHRVPKQRKGLLKSNLKKYSYSYMAMPFMIMKFAIYMIIYLIKVQTPKIIIIYY